MTNDQRDVRHPWLVRPMQRRSTKVAAIALANKIARIAWAMMTRIPCTPAANTTLHGETG